MASRSAAQSIQGTPTESEPLDPSAKKDADPLRPTLTPSVSQTDKQTDKQADQQNTEAATSSSPSGEAAPQDRLIVLAKDVASVKSMSNFLNRRGVETFVTNQLNDAVDRLTQGWTRFVLLSVNFPHPKVELIPQLFAQSFAAETIAFGESSDRKTAQKLTASRARNVIFGSASGPVVLMRLKQVQRQDLGQRDDEETTRGAAGPEDSSDEVRVKGSGGPGFNKSVHVKGGTSAADSAQAREEAASRFLRALNESGESDRDNVSPTPDSESSERGESQDDLSQESSRTGTKNKKPEIIIQKGARGSAPKSVAEQIQANQSGKTPGSSFESGPGQGRKPSPELAADGKAPGNAGSITERGSSGKISAAKSSRPNLPSSHALIMPTRKSKVHEALQSGQLSAEKSHDIESSKPGRQEALGQPPQAPFEAHGSTPMKLEPKPEASPKDAEPEISPAAPALPTEEATQTDIEIAARSALRRVYGEPRKEPDILLEYRSVVILIVHVESFMGTIMLAEGRGMSSASTRLPTLEREFLNALAERGHEIRIRDLRSMPFPNAAVAEEAFMAAEMSAVSRSDDYEAGIAFLNLIPSEAVIEETKDGMLKIGIEDVEPNSRINFDVFIYLPINAKYLKYVRQGYAISAEQSSRLKSRSVGSFYLEKASREHYLQHNIVKSVRRGIQKK